jgi:uncharacterized protein
MGSSEKSGLIRITTAKQFMIRFAAKIIVRHGGFFGVAAIVVTVFALARVSSLRFDVKPDAIFSSENQTSADLAELHRYFGPDENDVLVLFNGPRLFEIENHQRLKAFRDRLVQDKRVEHVASVFDLREDSSSIYPLFPQHPTAHFDPEKYQAQVVNHPLAKNQLVGDRGQMLVFWIKLAGNQLSISELIPVLESLQDRAQQTATDTDSDVHLGGHPAIRYDVLFTLHNAIWRTCLIAVLISAIVCMFLFGRLINVLIAVLPPAVGVCWVIGALAWCEIPLGGLMTAIPSLIFVIGLTNSIHLELDTVRMIARNKRTTSAAYLALLRIGPACWLTTLTTMIGFGSLVLSRTSSVQQFGIWSAVGTAIVLITVILTQPVLVMAIPSSWIAHPRQPHSRWISQVLEFTTAPFLKSPITTTLVSVAVCAVLLPFAFDQKPDIVWTETIPEDSQSTTAMQYFDEQFGGALQISVMVHWPKEQTFITGELVSVVDRVNSALSDTEGISAPYSSVDVLRGMQSLATSQRLKIFRTMPAAIRLRLVNEKERRLVVNARVPNDGAAALSRRLSSLESKLEDLRKEFPDYHLTVTGTSVAAAKNMNAIIADFGRSLAFASVSMLLVFTIAFRSIAIGLASLIPNAFPLLLTASILNFCGLPLQITSALTFSICLGLAVDDTIHMMVRYRALKQGNQVVSIIMQRTILLVGPALIVTTLVLVSGFLSMQFTPMPGIQMFATLCIVSLIAALVGDLLILPASLVLVEKFGRSRRRN